MPGGTKAGVAVAVAAAFEAFHARLEIGPDQLRYMDTVVADVRAHLAAVHDPGPDALVAQGSYRTGTLIRPDPDGSGGEFDIDLLWRGGLPGESGDEALDRLLGILACDPDYGPRVKRDRFYAACVKLDFSHSQAGPFHMDLVVSRTRATGDHPLEIALRGAAWLPRDVDAETAWFADQGPRYRRTVRMLKRWRDHDPVARETIKSAVLQRLVAECLPDTDDDAERLAGTLRGLERALATRRAPVPVVPHQTMPGLDMATRWTAEQVEAFTAAVGAAAGAAERALGAEDERVAIDRWRALLGSGLRAPAAA